MTKINIKRIVDCVVLRVAELPGRSSPDYQPTMMLVTPSELREIIMDEIEEGLRISESRR